MESVERKKREYRRKKITNYSRSSEAAAGSIPLITHSKSYLNIIYEACIYFILALGRVPCGKIMTTFLCRAKETGKDPTPFSWATGLGHIIRGKVHLLSFFSDSICPFQSSSSFITFHHYHFSTLR